MPENTQNKKVFYAVLNWGLGHATRSIPIIEALQKAGCKVTVASDGVALRFLKNHFGEAEFVELPELNLSYAASNNQLIHLFQQAPIMWRWWQADVRAMKNHLRSNTYDCIISDNRPGCVDEKIKCVYITHQYNVKAGLFSGLVSALHRASFKKFNEVWIPDWETYPGLAADLSHPKKKPQETTYIGPQSDLQQQVGDELFDVAVILSGPEPQRTMLENIAVNQLTQTNLRVVLLRGTNKSPEVNIPGNWKKIDVASRVEVSLAFAQSKVIVCRSGYSSLMDLEAFAKPAILIPTPGQPEQEYLATLQRGYSNRLVASQNELNLPQQFTEVLKNKVVAQPIKSPNRALENAIAKLLG